MARPQQMVFQPQTAWRWAVALFVQENILPQLGRVLTRRELKARLALHSLYCLKWQPRSALP